MAQHGAEAQPVEDIVVVGQVEEGEDGWQQEQAGPSLDMGVLLHMIQQQVSAVLGSPEAVAAAVVNPTIAAGLEVIHGRWMYLTAVQRQRQHERRMHRRRCLKLHSEMERLVKLRSRMVATAVSLDHRLNHSADDEAPHQCTDDPAADPSSTSSPSLKRKKPLR